MYQSAPSPVQVTCPHTSAAKLFLSSPSDRASMLASAESEPGPRTSNLLRSGTLHLRPMLLMILSSFYLLMQCYRLITVFLVITKPVSSLVYTIAMTVLLVGLPLMSTFMLLSSSSSSLSLPWLFHPSLLNPKYRGATSIQPIPSLQVCCPRLNPLAELTPDNILITTQLFGIQKHLF